jgi:hypothetical protein
VFLPGVLGLVLALFFLLCFMKECLRFGEPPVFAMAVIAAVFAVVVYAVVSVNVWLLLTNCIG